MKSFYLRSPGLSLSRSVHTVRRTLQQSDPNNVKIPGYNGGQNVPDESRRETLDIVAHVVWNVFLYFVLFVLPAFCACRWWRRRNLEQRSTEQDQRNLTAPAPVHQEKLQMTQPVPNVPSLTPAPLLTQQTQLQAQREQDFEDPTPERQTNIDPGPKGQYHHPQPRPEITPTLADTTEQIAPPPRESTTEHMETDEVDFETDPDSFSIRWYS